MYLRQDEAQETTLNFINKDAKVTAVDWSKNMIEEALGKEYDPERITYKIADVENLPFENESFDTVVDTFSLQRYLLYIAFITDLILALIILNSYYDRNKALSEIKRVLKPGGLFLMLGRGSSKISLYNQYLQFKAGTDIK